MENHTLASKIASENAKKNVPALIAKAGAFRAKRIGVNGLG